MDTAGWWNSVLVGLVMLDIRSVLIEGANLTVQTSDSSTGTSCPDSVVMPEPGAGPVTGEALFCYTCKETYVRTYDPTAAPCRNNVTSTALRRCGPQDTYCKVERLDLHRTVLSIERGCADSCPYGCRFNGYGLTYMRCTSCCRTVGCNTDSGAAPGTAPGAAGAILLAAAAAVQCCTLLGVVFR